MTAGEVIEILNLIPLRSEGGYFRLNWYAPEETCPPAGGKAKGYRSSSAIYYLITADDQGFSHLHRLKSHELWHFYGGGSVEMHLFPSPGEYNNPLLGMDLPGGERPFYPVPAGTWMAARLRDPKPGAWALLGNSLSPSFEEADYEEPKLMEMLADWPDKKDLLHELMPRGGQA